MTTVFTPTYNRAYILPELYKSLQAQTNKDFEWLVVDDGSTDDTESLFDEWIKEPLFPVRYIKQENGGKHRAINRGVKDAKGELFFIVDSDDYLTNNAIERILYHYAEIEHNYEFAGISAMRSYPDGNRIGGNSSFTTYKCSLFDFRYKYGVLGDIAEVYRTKVLAEYPFSDIAGEKFCPEALVWYMIAKRHKLYFFNENLYICDYLEDGLSHNSLKHRMMSPVYALMTYQEVWNSPVPLKQRIKAALSYWRFYFHAHGYKRINRDIPVLFMPIGYIISVIDKKKNK